MAPQDTRIWSGAYLSPLSFSSFLQIAARSSGIPAVGVYLVMGVFGYVTKRDLSGMGQFLLMAIFGAFIAQEGSLHVNHIPLYLDPARGPQGTLIGHVARATALWLKDEAKQVGSVNEVVRRCIEDARTLFALPSIQAQKLDADGREHVHRKQVVRRKRPGRARWHLFPGGGGGQRSQEARLFGQPSGFQRR